jgi:hypothetical protein
MQKKERERNIMGHKAPPTASLIPSMKLCRVRQKAW